MSTSASVAAPSEGETINAGADLTVTLDVDTLPSNLVLNPGFEAAGAGDPDFFEDWVETAVTGTIADEGVDVKSGSHAVKLTSLVGDLCQVRQIISVTAGRILEASSWAHGDGSSGGESYNRTQPSFNLLDNSATGSGTSYIRISAGPKVIPVGDDIYNFVTRGLAATANSSYFDDTAFSEPVCLDVRRTDDDNKWHVVVDTNGRPVLYERISGTDNPRIVGIDGDHTNGDTIEIICNGDDYTLNIASVQIGTYNGASALSSATIVYLKQIGSGAAVSDLTADWS